MSEKFSKVDVFLSSYNHAAFLRESIDSILNQSYQNFTLTIVDDGSTDESQEIIRSYSDPRIRPVLLEKNTGCGYYRDVLSSMTAEYVAVAHCDDKWMPDKLEKQVGFLESHPEYAACFTLIQIIDEQGQPFQDQKHFYYDLFDQENRDRFAWLRRFFYEGNCLCHPSLLIRREAYQTYEMFSTGLASLPDFYQWVALCAHGGELYVLQERLSCFRIRNHYENTSAAKPETVIRASNELKFILNLYRTLSPQELCAIFPQAQKYIVDGKCVQDYLLGRIMLEGPGPKAYTDVGISVLHAALSDPQKRAAMEELYGYDQKCFSKEMSQLQNDVFGAFDVHNVQYAMLYVDWGQGLREEERLSAESLVMPDGSFSVSFTLPAEKQGQVIRAATYYPDYGNLRMYKIAQILMDGTPVSFVPDRSAREDSWDVFYTVAPNYHLQFEPREARCITVQGSTKLLSPEKIAEDYERLLIEKTEQTQPQVSAEPEQTSLFRRLLIKVKHK